MRREYKMRPKTIASKTEVINFHIGSEQKKFLQTYAKKKGEVFSELVRVAIGRYVEDLKEEEEIAKLKEREEFKKGVLEYEAGIEYISKMEPKVREKEPDKTVVSTLDSLVKRYQLNDLITAHIFKEISGEVEQYFLSWRLGVIRQFFVLARKVLAWTERMEEIREMEEPTLDFIKEKRLIAERITKRKRDNGEITGKKGGDS